MLLPLQGAFLFCRGESHEAVGSVAGSTIVDERLIGVVSLIEISLAAYGRSLAIWLEHEILIAVISLFQWECEMIAVVTCLVAHLVFWEKTVVSPVGIDEDFSLLAWCLQREVYKGVVARRVVFFVVAIAHIEGSLCYLVVCIVGARHVWLQVHVIVFAVPADVVDAHRWMVDIQELKFSIFVAPLKDELSHMLPIHLCIARVVGTSFGYAIVPPAVL